MQRDPTQDRCIRQRTQFATVIAATSAPSTHRRVAARFSAAGLLRGQARSFTAVRRHETVSWDDRNQKDAAGNRLSVAVASDAFRESGASHPFSQPAFVQVSHLQLPDLSVEQVVGQLD